MMLVLKCGLAALAAFIGTFIAAIWLAPASTLDGLQRIARGRAGLERKEIEVSGIRHVYLEGGQGEPLLLLHGFGGEKDSFTRVARYLTPHYRVLIPDVPGFGESEKRTDINYSLDAIVERMHGFVTQLGLREISIGGNSMGGLISAAYAARYPSEVKTLWLLSAGPREGVPKSDISLRLEAQGGTLAPKTVEDFEQLMQYVVARPPRIPKPWLKLMAGRAMASQPLQQRMLEEITASAPMEARIQGLQVPALISWGDQDHVAHVAGAEAVHRMLPNSTLRIMPGIGHLPMTEDPRTAAADYLAFRDGLR